LNYVNYTFVWQPQLTGTVTETGDGRDRSLAGWTVFIDQNGNGQYDSGEPTAITNDEGSYAFFDDTKSGFVFQSGSSYTVGVVLPTSGFQIANGGPSTATFTFAGGTFTVNFQVWQ